MFKSAPGKDGATLVARPRREPRQAQRRRQDLDLHAAQGRQVRGRHAGHVARTSSTPSSARSTRTTFPNGPTYFNDCLDLQGYTSPYKDPSPDKLGLKAIETPDDQTIVFHLEAAVRAASTTSPSCPSTIPVPRGQGHRHASTRSTSVSTGPYMFETNELGKQLRRWSRNPNWDPATDPNRKPLPDKIEVQLERQRRRHRQPAALR